MKKADVVICMGSSCFARGNGDNLAYIEEWIERHAAECTFELVGSRCEGHCADGPNIRVNGTLIHGVKNRMQLDELLHAACFGEDVK